MASSQILVLVLVCSLVIVEAMPRMRPAKKAMRNSLVRFGKRADYDMPQTFLGEAFDSVPENVEGFYQDQRGPVLLY